MISARRREGFWLGNAGTVKSWREEKMEDLPAGRGGQRIWENYPVLALHEGEPGRLWIGHVRWRPGLFDKKGAHGKLEHQ